MPKKVIYKAVTERLEVLSPDGRVDEKLLPEISGQELIRMYELMHLMRRFDEKALNMQRQGRIGTYGSLRGQEAAQAGLAVQLRDEDWLVPSFREHGVFMGRGFPLHIIYAYWKGDERGNIFPDGFRALPSAVPVGSQLLHATGIGIGLRLRGESGIAAGFAGDGATSEGDFHEALNFAGVFRARTLFYIQNNQWAISVPRAKQTAAESIAQRAHGYGIPGIQVDGNDVLAVFAACRDALDHVRSGKGAYLIEASTYRMGDHTTADDHTRYRDKKEVEYWKVRDPIVRMRTFLETRELWDEDRENAMTERQGSQIEEEVRLLEEMSPPDPGEIFDHMYTRVPWHLAEQKQELLGGNAS